MFHSSVISRTRLSAMHQATLAKGAKIHPPKIRQWWFVAYEPFTGAIGPFTGAPRPKRRISSGTRNRATCALATGSSASTSVWKSIPRRRRERDATVSAYSGQPSRLGIVVVVVVVVVQTMGWTTLRTRVVSIFFFPDPLLRSCGSSLPLSKTRKTATRRVHHQWTRSMVHRRGRGSGWKVPDSAFRARGIVDSRWMHPVMFRWINKSKRECSKYRNAIITL